MADTNRELVPDNWSLVRERALATGLCSEGWYSEHSGVCRKANVPQTDYRQTCVTCIDRFVHCEGSENGQSNPESFFDLARAIRKSVV